jgi:hypothetical protein
VFYEKRNYASVKGENNNISNANLTEYLPKSSFKNKGSSTININSLANGAGENGATATATINTTSQMQVPLTKKSSKNINIKISK